MNDTEDRDDLRLQERIDRYVDAGTAGLEVPAPVQMRPTRPRLGGLATIAGAILILVVTVALALAAIPGRLPPPAIVGVSPPAPPLLTRSAPSETAPDPTRSAAPSSIATLLECANPSAGRGGSAAEISVGDAGASPAIALSRFLASTEMAAPRRGYEVLEEDSRAVIFVLVAQGKAKAAALVTLGGSVDFPGEWAVAEFRTCDSAEFSATTDFGVNVVAWSHPVQGLIHERPGAAHCDWSDIQFLTLDGTQYVRDVEGVLEDSLEGRFLRLDELPGDASPTGYTRSDAELWMSADSRYVYVVAGDHIERWPAALDLLLCR